MDPIVDSSFQISQTDRIVTAGSCFAQHIARRLQRSGYGYFVAEDIPLRLPDGLAEDFGYRMFSARYGNVYTSRQLVQLIDRAYGRFEPQEPFWVDKHGRVIDPFRPGIQPAGFRNLDEAELDRQQHLAAVRRLCEEGDVFIFTMGLTEAWESVVDGAVFPVCPGCGAGHFDPARYRFVNFDYDEVVSDMRGFIEKVTAVNPLMRFLLTVSPVPLVATASGDHVLTATVHSKAILRAAAGYLARNDDRVAYFPSFEIVTSPTSRGRYFAPDLRSVTEDGVNHVMRTFFRHLTEDGDEPSIAMDAVSPEDLLLQEHFLAADVACDEEILDSFSPSSSSSA